MASNSSATNKEPPGKVGRPTKFTSAMLKQARFLAARGATDAELADLFEVSESTLNLWKLKHGEFSEALKEGKSIADGRIQDALFQRAIGFSHPDTHVSNHQGAVTLTPVVKHYPPDTTAAIFWLKNRMPAEWRDKTEVTKTNIVEPKTDAEVIGDLRRSPAYRKAIEQMLEQARLPA